jgi:hypothetical protein
MPVQHMVSIARIADGLQGELESHRVMIEAKRDPLARHNGCLLSYPLISPCEQHACLNSGLFGVDLLEEGTGRRSLHRVTINNDRSDQYCRRYSEKSACQLRMNFRLIPLRHRMRSHPI